MERDYHKIIDILTVIFGFPIIWVSEKLVNLIGSLLSKDGRQFNGSFASPLYF